MGLEGIVLSEIGPTEKGKCCVISVVCGIFKKRHERQQKMNLQSGARGGGWGVGEMGGGGQKVPTPGYQRNTSQGPDVQHGDPRSQSCLVYLEVA